MTRKLSRSQLIEFVSDELRADGYDVFIDPSAGVLPPALESTRPDMIALGKPKNIAVLCLSDADRSPIERLERLQAAIRTSPDWALRKFFYSADSSSEALATASPEVARAEIGKLRDMSRAGFAGAALLMAWATFEAACRLVMPTAFKHPQTPGRLVERMAHEGYLTPSNADFVRALIPVRNRLVHGVLDTRVEPGDVTKFADVIAQLLDEALTSAAAE